MSQSHNAASMTLDELLEAANYEQGSALIADANARVHRGRRTEYAKAARSRGASISDIAEALGVGEKYAAKLVRQKTIVSGRSPLNLPQTPSTQSSAGRPCHGSSA